MRWSTVVDIRGTVKYWQCTRVVFYGYYETVKHREYFLRVGPARVGWTVRL